MSTIDSSVTVSGSEVTTENRTMTKDISAKAKRLAAIDMTRGLALIFMLIKHSAGRVPGLNYRPDFGWDELNLFANGYPSEIWIGLVGGTVIFFIMSGFGLAFFEASRLKKGWTQWQVSRYLLIRGAVLIAFDWLVLPWDFYPTVAYRPWAYFVLTSIAICLWCIAILRFLSTRQLIVLIVLITAGTQVLYYTLGGPPSDVNLVRSLFLYIAPNDPIDFGFPVIPWLAVMLVGFVSTRYIKEHPERFSTFTLLGSIIAFSGYGLVILFNDFGRLYHEHPLIMGKHPPSLDYLFFYFGITFACLHLFGRFSAWEQSPILRGLALLGQTSFFFYLIHSYVLSATILPLRRFIDQPVLLSFVGCALALVILYPLCVKYRQIRSARPNSLLQYL